MNFPFEELGSADNDARMRSVVEASRETGVPMPVVLRLQREYPEELPSVRMGSALFFPEGALPILLRLAEAEGLVTGSPAERGHGLLSLSRRRRELARRERASPPPAVPPPSGARASPEPVRRVSRPSAPTPSPPEVPASPAERAALAERLELLEVQQRRLTEEVGEAIRRLRRPRVARFPSA